jgi:Major Facilitator Superfamily
LFVACALSGAGWAAMGAAAINAIVAPWFVRTRPAALAMAYNGASIGGVVFSPLWVVAIEAVGFPLAAATVGLTVTLATWSLAERMLSRTPDQMGLRPDGDPSGVPILSITSASAPPRPGPRLWRDLKFLTLAAAMAVGLFAQIGLIAHLFSLLVPALGAQQAGLAMGLATASAIVGRTVVGWLMPGGADRRLVACASYAVQIAGCAAFVLAAGSSAPLLYAGIVLFGAGIGNATSLPPLIAQMEFAEHEVARVVALIVAIAQGTYAFAPLTFGLIREFAPQAAEGSSATGVFAAAALLQGIAICALVAGRGRWPYRGGKR